MMHDISESKGDIELSVYADDSDIWLTEILKIVRKEEAEKNKFKKSMKNVLER